MDYARRVIEENVAAEAGGRASFALDGRVIDVPSRAPGGCSKRQAAIDAREAAKRAATA